MEISRLIMQPQKTFTTHFSSHGHSMMLNQFSSSIGRSTSCFVYMYVCHHFGPSWLLAVRRLKLGNPSYVFLQHFHFRSASSLSSPIRKEFSLMELAVKNHSPSIPWLIGSGFWIFMTRFQILRWRKSAKSELWAGTSRNRRSGIRGNWEKGGEERVRAALGRGWQCSWWWCWWGGGGRRSDLWWRKSVMRAYFYTTLVSVMKY